MKLTSGEIRTLEKFLLDEIALCDEYVKTLQREQAATIKLDPVAVTEFGEKRADIVEKLAAIRDERAILVERLTGDQTTKVTDLVTQGCGASDRKRLLALTNKLKTRLATVDSVSREFSQILNFSLGLVNGELSLLWSATQPVTRVYNAHGGMTEGVQPGPPRSGSSLGKV